MFAVKIRTVAYVIPCFNESEVLPEFYRRVSALAADMTSYDFEFIFVNDGSTDDTARILNDLAEEDRRVKVLHFARNRGHQAAITAGMDFARSDLTVTIDADLQDPPELVKAMLKKAEEGFDVIHAQRKTRRGESSFKLLSADAFYRLMGTMTESPVVPNSGDYRAFTRPALKAMRGFREKHRYMRGLFSFVGFKQCVVQYDRDRRFAGTTKYPLRKMVGLAFNAFLSFSSFPIKLIVSFALFSWLVSLGYLTKAMVEHYVLKITVPGWTSIIILLTFFTGIIIFSLAIIGSYVGRIFEQGQGRPIYWVCDTRNVDWEKVDSFTDETRLSEAIVAGRTDEE